MDDDVVSTAHGDSCDEGILAIDAVQRHHHAMSISQPLPSYSGLVEAPREGKIGIACSGGGIRSAAFSLGALQVLGREGVLERSSYLAAVSGGSYIASAFCMIRKTWPVGTERPAKGTAGWDDSDPATITAKHPPFFPGSPEEQYLRNRSSYMAHGVGGKLQLGYRLVVGLLINLGFFALFLAVISAALAMFYGLLYSELTAHVGDDMMCGGKECPFTPLEIPREIYMPILAVTGVALLLEVSSMVGYSLPVRRRDQAATLGWRLLGLTVAAAVLLIAVPILLSLVRALGTAKEVSGVLQPSTSTGATAAAQVLGVGVGGVLTVGGALLVQFRSEWLELKKLALQGASAGRWYMGLSQRLRRALAYVVATFVGPVLALGLMLLTMSATLQLDPGARWIVLGALGLAFAIAYFLADLNTWSLHSFYRRRLCSAFALKRVGRPDDVPPIASDDAGVAEERSYNDLTLLSETAIADVDGEQVWPTLLVCASANISDDAATPPGRSVTSFTFSATAMGGPLVGAVRTGTFEKACDSRRKSYFTLPAAVAMSGAAISPSMGKSTKRPLRFLMTLANLRLGVWVPNPRHLETFDDATSPRTFPRPRPSYLLAELLGRNHVDARFLYVTDGGHYDNVGLVELLRRGCTDIYCFDASNDKLDAFGDAISLARSELNVQIHVTTSPLVVDPTTRLAAQDCVTGTIEYPGEDAPPARIHFARAVMTAGLPADVAAYHARDPRFPQDPTTDQLYLDQRFEAYRALGASAATHALQQSGRLRGG